jgi:hypothetical protein
MQLRSGFERTIAHFRYNKILLHFEAVKLNTNEMRTYSLGTQCVVFKINIYINLLFVIAGVIIYS